MPTNSKVCEKDERRQNPARAGQPGNPPEEKMVEWTRDPNPRFRRCLRDIGLPAIARVGVVLAALELHEMEWERTRGHAWDDWLERLQDADALAVVASWRHRNTWVGAKAGAAPAKRPHKKGKWVPKTPRTAPESASATTQKRPGAIKNAPPSSLEKMKVLLARMRLTLREVPSGEPGELYDVLQGDIAIGQLYDPPHGSCYSAAAAWLGRSDVFAGEDASALSEETVCELAQIADLPVFQYRAAHKIFTRNTAILDAACQATDALWIGPALNSLCHCYAFRGHITLHRLVGHARRGDHDYLAELPTDEPTVAPAAPSPKGAEPITATPKPAETPSVPADPVAEDEEPAPPLPANPPAAPNAPDIAVAFSAPTRAADEPIACGRPAPAAPAPPADAPAFAPGPGPMGASLRRRTINYAGNFPYMGRGCDACQPRCYCDLQHVCCGDGPVSQVLLKELEDHSVPHCFHDPATCGCVAHFDCSVWTHLGPRVVVHAPHLMGWETELIETQWMSSQSGRLCFRGDNYIPHTGLEHDRYLATAIRDGWYALRHHHAADCSNRVFTYERYRDALRAGNRRNPLWLLTRGSDPARLLWLSCETLEERAPAWIPMAYYVAVSARVMSNWTPKTVRSAMDEHIAVLASQIEAEKRRALLEEQVYSSIPTQEIAVHFALEKALEIRNGELQAKNRRCFGGLAHEDVMGLAPTRTIDTRLGDEWLQGRGWKKLFGWRNTRKSVPARAFGMAARAATGVDTACTTAAQVVREFANVDVGGFTWPGALRPPPPTQEEAEEQLARHAEEPPDAQERACLLTHAPWAHAQRRHFNRAMGREFTRRVFTPEFFERAALWVPHLQPHEFCTREAIERREQEEIARLRIEAREQGLIALGRGMTRYFANMEWVPRFRIKTREEQEGPETGALHCRMMEERQPLLLHPWLRTLRPDPGSLRPPLAMARGEQHFRREWEECEAHRWRLLEDAHREARGHLAYAPGHAEREGRLLGLNMVGGKAGARPPPQSDEHFENLAMRGAVAIDRNECYGLDIPPPQSNVKQRRRRAQQSGRVCNAGCGTVAPKKHKWPKSCCPACHERFKATGLTHPLNEPLQGYLDAALNVPWPTSHGALEAHKILATPKVKAYREGAKIEQNKRALLDVQELDTGAASRTSTAAHTAQVAAGVETRSGVGIKRRAQLHGIAISGHYPATYSKTDWNTCAAMRFRPAARPPGFENTGMPEPGFWEASEALLDHYQETSAGREYFAGLLFQGFGSYVEKNATVKPLRYHEWERAFPKSRAMAFRNGRKEYAKKPMPWWKLKQYTLFLKNEKGNQAGTLGDDFRETPAPRANPRAICNTEEVAHTILGPTLRPITKTAKGMLTGPVRYCSVSPEELNEWVNTEYPDHNDVVHITPRPAAFDAHTVRNPGKAFTRKEAKMSYLGDESPRGPRPAPKPRTYPMNDYSMMDNSYSRGAFSFLRKFYRILGFPSRGKVARLWWELGKVKGQFRYQGALAKIDAGYVNASGRDDTAVNNAIINAWLSFLGWLSAAHAADGREFRLVAPDIDRCREYASEMNIGIVGDDLAGGVPAHWRAHADLAESMAERGGFSCKMSFATRPEEMVFLGMRPYPVAVYDGSHWRKQLRWGKQLGRCMYKMGWQLQPTVDGAAWIKGVAWATLIGDGHVPILRALALAVMRRTEGVSMKIPTDLWKYRLPEDRKQCVIIGETYAMMQRVYGVSAQQIESAEDALLRAPALPCVVQHPVLDQIMAVDAADL